MHRKTGNKKNIKKNIRTRIAGHAILQDDKNMHNNAENKHVRLVLILAIVAVLCISLTIIIYSNMYKDDVIDYLEFNTSVRIVPSGAGLNTNTDSLVFGKNYPGGGGERHFTVYSANDAIVKIGVSGGMKDLLTFEPNDFAIKAKDTINITAYLDIPNSTALGNYSGKVHVYFYKPENN